MLMYSGHQRFSERKTNVTICIDINKYIYIWGIIKTSFKGSTI